jgi:hypothetical protein
MNDLYRTLQSSKTNPKKDDNEVSLFSASAKFQGKCGYCKKPGHMAKDCRMKIANQTKTQGNKGNTSKPLRPCKHCGGKHYDNKC